VDLIIEVCYDTDFFFFFAYILSLLKFYELLFINCVYLPHDSENRSFDLQRLSISRVYELSICMEGINMK